jgi:4-carboxymuconolactone decarboxylase
METPRAQTPRIAPLEPEHWDAETRDLLGKMLTGPDDRPINIFATVARHPKLLKRWLVFAAHVLSKNELPARDRELLILRTGWLCRAPYEWGQHVAIARGCGISDEEIALVPHGPAARGWTPFDAALLQAADELHAAGTISDHTWEALAERYDERQLLEVTFTVGQYHLVAFALNSCGVPLDAGIAGLPTEPVGAQLAMVAAGVADVDEAADRYASFLGDPGRRVASSRHEFSLGGVVLALVPGSGTASLVLRVDDVPAALARAEVAGFHRASSGERTVDDGWGNHIALAQR